MSAIAASTSAKATVDKLTSAEAPVGKHAIGCSHCDDEVLPPPTGVSLRGWFTIAAVALVLGGCIAAWFSAWPAWSAPLFLLATLVGAIFPAQRAVKALRNGVLDINALMVIAVVGAVAIRQWEEAAMVVSLFAAAQWLEAQSLDRARAAIRRVLDLAPTDVLVRDESGEHRVSIDAVGPGAVMIIRPGDKFPLDGIVTEGRSDVNQAPITGESLPVDKAVGHEVFAGTINGHGALTVKVTHRRNDTTLARIINLVESAQAQRAPVQLFIDRFAAWYTPAVLAMAALVATVPAFALGQPFDVWLYRSLVLLVVACPCALVISTPVSIVSALAGAARHGVLIKGGVHLERLASIGAIALDKTGTVTTGRLSVGEIRRVPGVSDTELIGVAASVESQSEHPIAAAILGEARRRGISLAMPQAVRALPGLGVEGTVNGVPVVCGTPRLFQERGLLTGDLSRAAAILAGQGASPVLVARDGIGIGAIALIDTAKDSAGQVMTLLRGEGITHIAMLTGDHEAAARAVAAPAGIDEVKASLLPQDKVEAIRKLRHDIGPVAMVGDGVNDAPALAAADVGVVMGAMGSHAALETADIALMTDDLSKLPYMLRLSKAALSNIRTNVAIAVGLKLLFVVLAAAGIATLWMAVLADTGASAIVVANAVRLRKFD
ncbi:MAG: heavy metal translocating P-type ATPase [Vicinamibacterales bacterium]